MYSHKMYKRLGTEITGMRPLNYDIKVDNFNILYTYFRHVDIIIIYTYYGNSDHLIYNKMYLISIIVTSADFPNLLNRSTRS